MKDKLLVCPRCMEIFLESKVEGKDCYCGYMEEYDKEDGTVDVIYPKIITPFEDLETYLTAKLNIKGTRIALDEFEIEIEEAHTDG